jgi:hypothetical protein
MRRAAQKAKLDEQARRARAAAAGIRCPACGEVDMPLIRRRGSRGLHIFLYLWYIVPGVIYGYWRNKVRFQHCRKCDAIMGSAPTA